MIKFATSIKQMRQCHHAVKKAIKAGVIKIPKECSKCLKEKTVIAHHTDYEKPIDIVWLCRSCHSLEHSMHGFSAVAEMVIRLWPENEKRVKEFLKSTGMPFSPVQLCNWIIANADFEGTAKEALTKGKK